MDNRKRGPDNGTVFSRLNRWHRALDVLRVVRRLGMLPFAMPAGGMIRFVSVPTVRTSLIVVAVFVFDGLMPRGIAASVLYMAAVISAVPIRDPRSIYVTAAICSCLVVVAAIADEVGLAPPQGETETWKIVLNRTLTIAAIWVVAGMAHSWKNLQQRRQKQLRESRVLHQATALAAADVSFRQALQNSLESLCDILGWPVGHVYLMKKGRLCSTNLWYPADKFQLLQAVAKDVEFADGEGVPGRILQTGQPIMTSDVAQSPNYGWMREPERLGIVGAFAFPILVRGKVAAVIEFFATEHVATDLELMPQVRKVGEQLGRLFERKQLEEQYTRLAAIVESSYDAIIGKSLDGTITSWNNGAERVYGYTAQEAIGQPTAITLPPDADGEEPEIQRALDTGERLEQFETTRRCKDGSLIPVSLTLSPIADNKGHIIGGSSIERDVSERRRKEQELRDAKEAAEAANRARSAFLANVSHELRTPMNAIVGMLELALSEELPAAMRDYLETADEAAHTLMDLLNDILDFTRMEAGRFELDVQPFSLRETLDKVTKTLAMRAHEKGLELVEHVHSNVPDRLTGDGRRLRQVVMNLAGNAIKFTEQGEVVIEAAVDRIADGEAVLHLTVSDSGMGISAEDRERIFQPFEQVNSTTTRRYSGTGLGLTICRQLIERMGGTLWVESELGAGSRFHLTARFDLATEAPPAGRGTVGEDSSGEHSSAAEVSAAQPELQQLQELRGMPVLVVDDNHANRRMFEDVLTGWQMQAELAADGNTGLSRLRAAANGERPFALVITDALMPGIDGFTFIEEASYEGILDVPVILMLSASDRQVFDRRCSGLGIAAYLEKPVSQTRLADAILTAWYGPQQRAVAPDIQPLRKTLRVLLAEDTPANQKVVKAMLEKRGHNVEIAHNGREAVDLHKQNRFDVIVMDVQMPTMDGYQAAAAIRELEWPPDPHVPIIALTAHAMRGDRERSLDAGMDDYIAKPIDARELIQVVEKFAVRNPQTSVESGRENDSASAPAAQEPPVTQEAVIDRDGALQRLGNEKLLRDMASFFCEDSPGLLRQIHAGLEHSDPELVARSAHSLKGLCSNFGAEEAVAAAQAVEEIGRSGDFDGAAAALAQLEREVGHLRPVLEQMKDEG